MIKRKITDIAIMAAGELGCADESGRWRIVKGYIGEDGRGRIINGHIDDRIANVMITGVSTDTRTLQPGNLYIPLVGERFDGHEFVRQAIDKGAAAVMWSRGVQTMTIDAVGRVPVIFVEDTLKAMQRLAAAYRRQLGLRVVGVTGSNGKTSTKDILASVLSVRYRTQKTFGNLNNHIGVPLTILALREDTEIAVVEMGMSGLGEIRELAEIVLPDIAIITNVSEVHLGDLLTRERIMQAKLEITEHLTREQLFIYNGDHELLHRTVQEMNLPCMRMTVGEQERNQLYAQEIKVTSRGTELKAGGKRYYVPVLGRHQAFNALAAIAAARHAGLTDEEIRCGLQNVQLTGMRLEWTEIGGISVINDAYKSNPSSVKAALELVYELQPFAQKIAVLGDMVELGEESEALHQEIGEGLRSQHLDYVFTIGMKARDIAFAAEKHFPRGRVRACHDQVELLAEIKDVLQDGSLLLVKGSRTLGLEQLVEVLKREAAG